MTDKDQSQSPQTDFPLLKDDAAPSATGGPFFAERPPESVLVPRRRLAAQTRRDFLVAGAGAALAAGGFWWLLPEDTQARLRHTAAGEPSPRKTRLLNGVLRFDDDVAEALYSSGRHVPTYDKRLALSPDALRNNYDGQTPDPDYIPNWRLTVSGLASGRRERLTLRDIERLIGRAAHQEGVTRLVCVEGWSAIAWWGGLRFADFLAAYPPAPGMTWVQLRSDVNLDGDGNSDPYFVSIDLDTARHPQTLLATHQHGRPLMVEHGAPLRLIAPMKLGLKNIKAITHIAYSAHEPADYWNQYGYSRYDGL